MSTLEIDVGDLRARSVEFTATELVVTLLDGRRIATPLDWYPRLVKASAAQRANYEIMPMGIHWPDLGGSGYCRNAGGPPRGLTSVARMSEAIPAICLAGFPGCRYAHP